MARIAVTEQVVIPAALLCRLAFARIHSTAIVVSGALAPGALLLVIERIAPALLLPRWLAAGFVVLGPLGVAAGLAGWRRGCQSIGTIGIPG